MEESNWNLLLGNSIDFSRVRSGWGGSGFAGPIVWWEFFFLSGICDEQIDR